MNTDHLKEFLTLAQCKSFNAAAKAIGISQPSLSKHISRLEEELGFELVTRSIPVALTKSGELFYVEGSQLFASINDLIARCKEAETFEPCEIKVQSYEHDSAVEEAMIKASDELLSSHQGATVSTINLAGKTTAEAIAAQEIDLGYQFFFGTKEEAIRNAQSQGLAAFTFPRSFNTVALKKRNPLAKQKTLTLRNLSGIPIMLNERGVSPDTLRSSIETMFEAGGGHALFKPTSVNNIMDFLMLDPGTAIYLINDTTSTKGFSTRESMTLRKIDIEPSEKSLWGLIVYDSSNANTDVESFASMLAEALSEGPLE